MLQPKLHRNQDRKVPSRKPQLRTVIASSLGGQRTPQDAKSSEANNCNPQKGSFTALPDSLQLSLQFRSSYIVTHHFAAGINEHHGR